MKERIKSLYEIDKSMQYWGSQKQPFWRPGPNPTVDLLIVKDSKEILLIKRSLSSPAEPGKWAFPGGFHDTTAKKGEPWKPGKETAKEAAIRELEEETGLHGSEISNNLIEVNTYEGASIATKAGFIAHSGRDPRDNDIAWTLNTLFAINIKDINQEAKGMDDASDAKWFSIKDALKMKLAFDHSELLLDGLKKLKLRY